MLNHNTVIAAALSMPKPFGEVAGAGTKTLLFKGEHGDVRIELPTEQAVALTWNILDYLLDVTLASVSAGAQLGLEVFDEKGELTDRAYNAGVSAVRQHSERLFVIE